MAQRQRAGLITPRSLDRNGLPVSLYLRSLILDIKIVYKTSNIFDINFYKIKKFYKRLSTKLGINYKLICVLGKPVVIQYWGAR